MDMRLWTKTPLPVKKNELWIVIVLIIARCGIKWNHLHPSSEPGEARLGSATDWMVLVFWAVIIVKMVNLYWRGRVPSQMMALHKVTLPSSSSSSSVSLTVLALASASVGYAMWKCVLKIYDWTPKNRVGQWGWQCEGNFKLMSLIGLKRGLFWYLCQMLDEQLSNYIEGGFNQIWRQHVVATD